MNWHNRTYFVDCVDFEFCLNSKKNNLKIGECSLAPGFDHESEQGDDKYTIFGKNYSMRKYPMGRIFDTLLASSKLLILSIKTRNYSFSRGISRFLVGYLIYQFMARIINNSTFEKKVAK
jgi:rhamnosyltransferase